FGQYKLAFAGWEPLANEGYRDAQATLAWMYHTGKGVKKNLRAAHYWYTRASDQKHIIAANNLGVFYEQGLGVQQNLGRAAEMYLEAAELGYSYAQYNLGMLYHNGQGVEKNKNEAIFWLQIAALQGVTQAQDTLESMGRRVVIPEHKKLNDSLLDKSKRPKWHRKTMHGMNMNKRSTSLSTQSQEDFYQKERKKLAAAADTSSISTATANQNSSSSKRKSAATATTIATTETVGQSPRHTSTISPHTRALLERNRALVGKRSNDASDVRHTVGVTPTSARHKQKKSEKLQASSWVKKQNPKRYTLQIAGSHDLEKLKSLAALLNNSNNTAYYHTHKKGKSWYNLIYGVYPSRGAAQKKIKTLPNEFKQWSPWIRRFSEVQEKMAINN
ncbi:MAG: SPOR domain-containing protein, partial [Thiohalomonadales bacterium]